MSLTMPFNFNQWIEDNKDPHEDNELSLEEHDTLFLLRGSDFTKSAMSINDDGTLTLEQREAKLTELFEKHGHEIEFVGEPVYQNKELKE